MIEPRHFADAAKGCGFAFYTGVPCSYLAGLIDCLLDRRDARYVPATNEGQAVAIAAGARLAGVGAVAIMQNSGLGNAVSPLASLNHIFRIPVLLVVSLRGAPGGGTDEPQHELMGRVTLDLLRTIEVPWAWFPEEPSEIRSALECATDRMATGRSFALVLRRGTIARHHRERPLVEDQARVAPPRRPSPPRPAMRAASREMLETLQKSCPDDVIVASTGHIGRELYGIDDRPNQIYLVGAMGCASSVGLGLACSLPDRRIVVADGDGAALMHLGAMATIGAERPANLTHVVLDNEAYASTGGQECASRVIDLAAVAEACGYPNVYRESTCSGLAGALAAARDVKTGPTFIHAKIGMSAPRRLPRPAEAPADVATRLSNWLRDSRVAGRLSSAGC